MYIGTLRCSLLSPSASLAILCLCRTHMLMAVLPCAHAQHVQYESDLLSRERSEHVHSLEWYVLPGEP